MWSVYEASSAAEASLSAVYTGLGEITLGLSLAICSAVGTHTVALRQPERPNKHGHLILNNTHTHIHTMHLCCFTITIVYFIT